jgi:bifunctional enzyme CysN/CysC
LRFITCGSVDDGKSTLIGRLLYESHLVFEDHLAALERDSRTVGTQGGELDFALLVDGLSAEREQGITIDVAYRFFSTETRSFIVADTPGHEQYTRNMVTGASTADLAVLLVDARRGLLPQTRRHSSLVSLVGIRSVVVAVNKLDLVDWSREVYDRIVADYAVVARKLGIEEVVCIPMSALQGDNMMQRSKNTPWYDGPTLMEHLQSVPIRSESVEGGFRMPVQWVNRPDLDFRGFAGLVGRGSLAPGDAVVALPSGVGSTVSGIVLGDSTLPTAQAGQSVTLTLADEIDVSRGDLLCAADDLAAVSARWKAHVVWMHTDALRPGAAYHLKCGSRWLTARLSSPSEVLDVETLTSHPGATLQVNDIGVCELRLDRPLAADPYDVCRETGAFVLVDRLTNATVAAGMLREPLGTSGDVVWQQTGVDRAAREELAGHRGAVVWLTGLSGSGKSTIADAVQRRLHAQGVRTYVLDGDNLRHGLTSDLGFSAADRDENVRRVGHVASLMADAGVVVLVSLISPLRAQRDTVRGIVGNDFLEVWVDAPLAVVEGRDVKGLYARARSGEIAEFTGISSPYEEPLTAELHLDTSALGVGDATELVLGAVRSKLALHGA